MAGVCICASHHPIWPWVLFSLLLGVKVKWDKVQVHFESKATCQSVTEENPLGLVIFWIAYCSKSSSWVILIQNSCSWHFSNFVKEGKIWYATWGLTKTSVCWCTSQLLKPFILNDLWGLNWTNLSILHFSPKATQCCCWQIYSWLVWLIRKKVLGLKIM